MTAHITGLDVAWTLIIPVKMTNVAKSRLTGLTAGMRRELALAFALDATLAARQCTQVRDVVVVTNDDRARRALTGLGATVLADVPDSGLDAAVAHGVAHVRAIGESEGVAAMLGDLPALRPAHLTAAFSAAHDRSFWLVSDAEGLGTTMLGAGPGTDWRSAFGTGSRAAHVRLGARDVSGPGQEGLRRDVDTEQHLDACIRLGVGPFTSAALASGHVDRPRTSA